jgi:hypothetical protein
MNSEDKDSLQVFRASDADKFQSLVAGILGARCTGWRETYANGLVLEFGRSIIRPDPISPQQKASRAEWIVSTWGCDVFIADRPEEFPGSLVDDVAAISSAMTRVVGDRLEDLILESGDMSLVLKFAGGVAVSLRTDREAADLDQWFILTPSSTSIGATGAGTWYVRKSSLANGAANQDSAGA